VFQVRCRYDTARNQTRESTSALPRTASESPTRTRPTSTSEVSLFPVTDRSSKLASSARPSVANNKAAQWTETSDFHNPGWSEYRQQSKHVSKLIWQKAASPTCHPLRLRMDSFDLDPIKCKVPWTHMSRPPTNAILIGSAVFAQYISVTSTQTHSPRYTGHATCDICHNRPHLCMRCGLTVADGTKRIERKRT